MRGRGATLEAIPQTPLELIAYRRRLVRERKYIPLGLMKQIAIAPSDHWKPPAIPDPLVQLRGRLIDFRNRPLPIAQSVDKSMILVTAPIAPERDGRIGLPDIPDPSWTRPAFTREEIEGREEVRDGTVIRVPVVRDIAKDTPVMVPQRLTDRCDLADDGNPGIVPGTNFLCFQPVERVTFQPEIENRLVGDAWLLMFTDPAGNYWVDGNGRSCSLLIDPKTGEVQFNGGLYDIYSPSGFGG